jgi:mono/diheme cytochrome c family protein
MTRARLFRLPVDAGVGYFAGVFVAAATLLGCNGGGASGGSNVTTVPPRGGPFVPEPPPPPPPPIAPACNPAHASEDLRPRADLTAGGVPGMMMGAQQTVPTKELFSRFNTICGNCHVTGTSGGKHTSEETFATVVDETWLAAMESDDPAICMPQPAALGTPCSVRRNEPDMQALIDNMKAWIAQGRPTDQYTYEDQGASKGNTAADYMFAPAVAAAMTNLGNCIPNKEAYAISTGGVMESMDEVFAGATALPKTIAETDLITFDSETLAANGVIAYVPTYPLWSDGSGKLRHIRVPRGQTVKFDKDKQTFDIPANTRFYKTFFRKVVDRTGVLRNRKMETRLIVARPPIEHPDGTVDQTALFGTYIWSADETSAKLTDLTYRDGNPFPDETLTYYTDELEYQDILNNGVGPGTDATYDARLQAVLDEHPGLEQRYGVPGKIRCLQCHQGSPTKDFVLGFFPLQVARRADGTGGTYEPTGDDEVTQLQRLIDYGVISGMASPADVLPLEQSEGTRKPRTEGELKAQAYMVGNCAHCHNPRGFPSIAKPALAGVLNFMPDADKGGVFEFKFDTVSPVRQRGANGDVSIPYITPSLNDYPVATDDLVRIDNGISVDPANGGQPTWTPKFYAGNGVREDCSGGSSPLKRAFCRDRTSGPSDVPAPWMSLIYRNVDTPYQYFDDFVPFPHMPMHTPGYDCRAPRIMAEWMVGLPARLQDLKSQPYQEVHPGDPDYAIAVDDANDRLKPYHDGIRYQYCQDVLSADILDPIPSTGPYQPDTTRFTFQGTPPFDPTRPGEYVQPSIGVPYHDHWFEYDPTEPNGEWSPRRPDWKKVVVDQEDDITPADGEAKTVPADELRQRHVTIDAINAATLSSELQTYARKKIPFGLWQVKPECAAKLAAQDKVSKFLAAPTGDGCGSNACDWISRTNPAPDRAVYQSTPGAMIYRHICFNCHGPNADGKGLQGDALASASDGKARPADFRDGLFGPMASPGANLLKVFSAAMPGSTSATDAEQWASRYMAWMALGGTLRRIPQDIIHQVEATTVLGEHRQSLFKLPGAGQVSANMLNLAKALCALVLPDPIADNFLFPDYGDTFKNDRYPPYNILPKESPFITTNGDKDMWLTLCSQFSPQVIRVYTLQFQAFIHLSAIYYADGYPESALVLDQNQQQVPFVSQATSKAMGVPLANNYPACFEPPTRPEDIAFLAKPDNANFVASKSNLPPCDPGFLSAGRTLWREGFEGANDPEGQQTYASYVENVSRWMQQGAAAAGMAVFTYLHDGGAQTGVDPYYNECELLK